MKGCGLLVASNGVEQGSTEMTTRKVRQGFQGRSWGAADKMFLISQLCLEYILVVIRVLEKNAKLIVVLGRLFTETGFHADIY